MSRSGVTFGAGVGLAPPLRTTPPLTVNLHSHGPDPSTQGLVNEQNQRVCNVIDDNGDDVETSHILTRADMMYAMRNRAQMFESLQELEPVQTIVKMQSYDDLMAEQVVRVTKTSETNAEGNVNDLKMGTYDRSKRCATCNNDVMTCPGHFGVIELPEMMVHPLAIKTVIDILRSVCHACGKLLVSEETLRDKNILPTYGINEETGQRYVVKYGLHGLRRLKEIAKESEGNNCMGDNSDTLNEVSAVCSPATAAAISVRRCGSNVTIKSAGKNDIDIKYTCAGQKDEAVMPAEDIFAILDAISDEDAKKLGLGLTHPRDLIMRALPVLPPCDRPPVSIAGVIEDSSFTALYNQIIRNINIITETDSKLRDSSLMTSDTKEDNPDDLLNKRIQASMNIKRHIRNLINAPETETINRQRMKSVRTLVQGKEGFFRGNLQGIRVDKAGRTVIDPDPTLPFGWIRIPRYMADILTRPITVTQSNYHEMQSLIRRRKVKTFYTNDPRVGRMAGKTVTISDDNRDTIADGLAIGDVLAVHMREGDWVIANRQPTLHKEGMLGFRVIIGDQKSIGLHPLSTTPFNADFDGDEMNIHFPQNQDAILELAAFADSRKCLISAQTNKPIVGMIMNLISGPYVLTQDGMLVDERTFNSALALMSRKEQLTTLNDRLDVAGIPRLSGKALFSALLPENFYYDHRKVKIVNGVMIKGRLTKAHLGAAHKSIIQAIHNDYGKDRASDFINDSNFVFNRWLRDRPLTVGINDCFFNNPDVQESINRDVRSKMLQVEAMGYEPDDPVELQRYEDDIKALVNITEVIGKRVLDELDDDNGLIIMARSGGKGNERNAAQITTALGQQFVEGKRIERGMPWFADDSLDPAARGFILSSYADGVTPAEYVSLAMGSREGLLDTATKTAEVGHLRNKMKAMVENERVGIDGSTRNSNDVIIQVVAGTTGFNPEYMEMVPLSDGSNVASIIDFNRTIGRLNAEAGFFGSPLAGHHTSDNVN